MMNISRYDMMVLFNAIYLASFGNITNTIDLRLAGCNMFEESLVSWLESE